jgi:acetylornithine deacetylase
LRELLTLLVSVESVNPAFDPGASGEGRMAEVMLRWLQRQGIDVVLQPVRTNRPNVVASVHGTRCGPTLAFVGHTDTVGADSMPHAFEVHKAGSRWAGRGVLDMKGGLAAAMTALAALSEEPREGDLLFAGVIDEEHRSLGAEAFVEAYRPSSAVITEPTGETIQHRHNGFLWLVVELHGSAAHGGWPGFGGVDAILHMGPMLDALRGLAANLRTRGADEPGPSLHASLIGGGQDLSSYPATCRLHLERRFTSEETADAAQAEIEATIRSAVPRVSGLSVSVSRLLARDPLHVDPQAPVVLALQEAVWPTRRAPAPLTSAFGWTDAQILQQAGTTTVLFGPTGGGAHAPDEWVDILSVERVADALVRLGATFHRSQCM